MHTTLMTAEQLQQLMASGQALAVFDCSSDLMNPIMGEQAYAQGHIPSARHAQLDRDLSAHLPGKTAHSEHHDTPATASGGRHPLPTRENFAQWLGSQGVNEHTQVVVYDRNGMNYCGRLWWMLKWCGHDAVAVLDGGWSAWQAAGGGVETGTATGAHTATTFTLKPELAPLVDTTTVLKHLGQTGQTLMDARATPRFRGEVEPMDPIAGHIPGALNRPFAMNLAADGLLKSPDELKAEFLSLLDGREPASVVHHCGSGVSAVPNLLAMAVAGLGMQPLYAGSWSEWSRTPGLPVEKS